MKTSSRIGLLAFVSSLGLSLSAWAAWQCCSLDSVALCGDVCCKTECASDGTCPDDSCPSGQEKVSNGECCDSNKVAESGSTKTCCGSNETVVGDQCCASDKVAGSDSSQTCCGEDETVVDDQCCASDKVAGSGDSQTCCGEDETVVDGKCQKEDNEDEDEEDNVCPDGGTLVKGNCCRDGFLYDDESYGYVIQSYSSCGVCPEGSSLLFDRFCCKGLKAWNGTEWKEDTNVWANCFCAGREGSVVYDSKSGVCMQCLSNKPSCTFSGTVLSASSNCSADAPAGLLEECCNQVGGIMCHGKCLTEGRHVCCDKEPYVRSASLGCD